MPQQQQQQEVTNKQKFNVAFNVSRVISLGLLIMSRSHWGKEELAFPCAFAFVLMFIWYVLSGDPLMGAWLAAWFLIYLFRKFETARFAGQIHSYYDGLPYIMRIVKNEKVAKLLIEPILFGILGFSALQYYEEMEWSPTGLPYFLLTGIITIPFVELVNQIAHERKVQGMVDARLENEALMEDFPHFNRR